MTHFTSLLCLLLAPVAQAQSPCTGWTLDNELQPVVAAPNGVGHGGSLVAAFGILDSASSLGGVSLHRVLPAGAGVELVDSFAQTGLGPGFAAFTFGCAVSDGGAVLLARKRPLPFPVELIQFRNTGTLWSSSSFEATGTSLGQTRRHFHSDGNVAAVAAIPTGNTSGPTVLDILTVDPASGDWFVEATVSGGPSASGFFIGNVTVRGSQVVLAANAGPTSAFAWERTAPGQWTAISLPPEVAVAPNDMWQLALAGDLLVSLHVSAGVARIELRERSGGAWVLAGTTVLGSTIADSLHFDGDHLVLERADGFDLFERTAAGTFVQRAILDGDFLRLGDGYVVASFDDGAQPAVNVLPIDELGAGRVPCFTRGRNVCTAQTGGGLRFLPQDGSPVDGVLLTGAPAGSIALLLGQRSFLPPAMPAVDSLCLPGGPPRVVTHPIRTSAAGDGLWRLDPGNLSTGAGMVSYTGSLAAFQALVRVPGGAVSTNAVWVQL